MFWRKISWPGSTINHSFLVINGIMHPGWMKIIKSKYINFNILYKMEDYKEGLLKTICPPNKTRGTWLHKFDHMSFFITSSYFVNWNRTVQTTLVEGKYGGNCAVHFGKIIKTFVYLKLQGPFYSLGWICLSYISRRQNSSHLFELILKFGQLFEKRWREDCFSISSQSSHVSMKRHYMISLDKWSPKDYLFPKTICSNSSF